MLQEREDLVGDRAEHRLRILLLEPAPSQVLLTGQEDRILQRLLREVRLILGQRLALIQAPDEQQIRNLLDDLQRVTDPAGPEGIPDAVDLALQLTSDHAFRLSGRGDNRWSPQCEATQGV